MREGYHDHSPTLARPDLSKRLSVFSTRRHASSGGGVGAVLARIYLLAVSAGWRNSQFSLGAVATSKRLLTTAATPAARLLYPHSYCTRTATLTATTPAHGSTLMTVGSLTAFTAPASFAADRKPAERCHTVRYCRWLTVSLRLLAHWLTPSLDHSATGPLCHSLPAALWLTLSLHPSAVLTECS